ncbi:MAG: formate dehydrogenase subunit alpha [Firmicutes bacterium]|nr:formate dehydrogenase subunit alpha [Bacillota bacterium]
MIDGSPVEFRPGDSLLAAARRAGVDIPSLCSYPGGDQGGGSCRLCLVEIEGRNGPVPACRTPAREGMAVQTETPLIIRLRRTILELLLADHPLDCLCCWKAGECRLQDLAYRHGVRAPRRLLPPPDRPAAAFRAGDWPSVLSMEPDKCILCGSCVAVCGELHGIPVWNIRGLGRGAAPVAGGGGGLPSEGCRSCGACAEVCPVGAIVPRTGGGDGVGGGVAAYGGDGSVRVDGRSGVHPGGFRTWQRERVRTVCPYCGVGCNIRLETAGGRILLGRPDPECPVSGGRLCVKGAFGLDFIGHPDRLTRPLVRRGGKGGDLEAAGWEEALSFAARSLLEIRERRGSGKIGVIGSAKTPNEDCYALQKFARAVLGTPHVDHCARLCHSSTLAGLSATLGSGTATGSLTDIAAADLVFVIGSNTTESHPVVAYKIRKAVRSGARLVVADPRRVEIARSAHLHLRHRPGTDVALLNGLLQVIDTEGLADRVFIEERTEGYAEAAAAAAAWPPHRASEVTGVPAEAIREAARLYAGAARPVILYAMGITQHHTATMAVTALAGLALACGGVGREGAGIFPLRGHNNVQGACDMGVLPDLLPGYRKTADPDARLPFEGAWGVPIPSEPGLTVVEMSRAAARGDLAALWIVGENSYLSEPEGEETRRGLENLEFLAVQDLFLTETAALADVVFPAAGFAEREGTVTNTERRVQLLTRALEPPLGARPDWEILADMARRLGRPLGFDSLGGIADEIRRLVPSYAGITLERLRARAGGLQWPCPDPAHPGTPTLHLGGFPRGRARFLPADYRPPAEEPDEAYPLLLTTGRVLYHFHTGSLTRRSPALDGLHPLELSEVNPADAARLGVHDGDEAWVVSRRGRVRTRVRLTERVPAGTIFMTFHFRETPANLLTIPALDPISRIPEYKVCAVRLEREGAPSTAQA